LTRKALISLLFIAIFSACILGLSSSGTPKVIVIQDELPQMKVLSKFLREKGQLSVTITDQTSFPQDLSVYDAVIVFIHGNLSQNTEKAIIKYTKNGGKLICLHHSISSAKAKNKFYFNFIGIQLDTGPMEKGGYKWKESSWSLVNLNLQHFITKTDIKWNEKINYTPSDHPSSEKVYQCITLKEDSEVFINHKFTDGRQKVVLCGTAYYDKDSDKTYMQDRGAWIKRQGKGNIIYFMPGHIASDYENKNISQMILNAIIWSAKSAPD